MCYDGLYYLRQYWIVITRLKYIWSADGNLMLTLTANSTVESSKREERKTHRICAPLFYLSGPKSNVWITSPNRPPE